jgi:hypothetical protein
LGRRQAALAAVGQCTAIARAPRTAPPGATRPTAPGAPPRGARGGAPRARLGRTGPGATRPPASAAQRRARRPPCAVHAPPPPANVDLGRKRGSRSTFAMTWLVIVDLGARRSALAGLRAA